MNTVLDHEGYIPAFVDIGKAKTHESCTAKNFSLPRGSIVTFDKGYICYSWFLLLAGKAIFFITHLKDNASCKLIERRPVNRKSGVTSDHIIEVVRREKTILPTINKSAMLM